MPNTSDLSQIPTSEIEKALKHPSEAARENPPDLSGVPSSAIQRALDTHQSPRSSQVSPIARAAQSLIGTNGGRLGCATTACAVLKRAGISFPETASAGEMEREMITHGFERTAPGEADIVFGRGTGPSGRHAMVHIGGGRTVEDPGGARGNLVQYGRLPAHDPTLSGFKYVGNHYDSGNRDGSGYAGGEEAPDPAGSLRSVPSSQIEHALRQSHSGNSRASHSPAAHAPLGYVQPATWAMPGEAQGASPSGVNTVHVHPGFVRSGGPHRPLTDADFARLRNDPGSPLVNGWPQGAAPPAAGNPASSGSPAAPRPGAFYNLGDFLGLEGHRGGFHKGLSQFGVNAAANAREMGQAAAQVPDLVLRATGNDPAQYGARSQGEADAIALHSQRQAARAIVKSPVNQVLGPQSMLGHGAQAARAGTLKSFLKGVPAGVGHEAYTHPLDEAMNVLSLVGGGEMTLTKGAEGALGAAGKLRQAADAAESAGNGARASTLRHAAQTAHNMGQDLSVAAARYHRGVTAGPVGDVASQTAAALAEKYLPGSLLSHRLRASSLKRSIGKAVSDHYDGYKVARDQAQGRIVPNEGDINIGGAAAPHGTRAGAESPGAEAAGTQATGNKGISLQAAAGVRPASPLLTPPRTLPALPPPSPEAADPEETDPELLGPQGYLDPRGYAGWMDTPEEAAVAEEGADLSPQPASLPQAASLPLSPAGKPLHLTEPGINGSDRHADGTFAPAPDSSAPDSSATEMPDAAIPADAATTPSGAAIPDLATWNHVDWRTFGVPQDGGAADSLTADDLARHVQKNGGKVGAVVWDRTRLGKYIPRDPESGIDIDLHGGPRTPLNAGWKGKAGTAVSSASQGTVLNNLADKTGGSTLVVLGDHSMSMGNPEFHEAYHQETQHQIKQGLLRPDDLDAAGRQVSAAILKREPKAFKGRIIHSWADYHRLAPALSFDTRSKFLTGIGGSNFASKIGTVPHYDVIAGFNDYHDVPTGHVVGAIHLHPDQGKARTAAQLGIPAHPSYPYVSAGHSLGEFKQPFPASLVFDRAVRAYAAAHGKSYLGTPSSLNYWLPRGYTSVTDLHPGIIKDVKSHQQDALAAAEGALHDSGTRTGNSATSGTVTGRNLPQQPDESSDLPGRIGANARGSGSLPSQAADGRQPGSGGADSASPIGGRFPGRGSNGPGSDRPLTAAPGVISPDGRQVALKGKSGTLYVNARAYKDLTDRLGMGSSSQGVALRVPHVEQINRALLAATRDYQRDFKISARSATGQQYVADLTRTANILKRGLADKAGLPVVKVEPGQTLSQTKAVARHERAHTGSYEYPLSPESRHSLDQQLSDPSHPLHVAYAKARAAIAQRGYAPEKTWDEIPAIISGGPSQYGKAGLSDTEARSLGTQYAKRLIAEHGPDAVRAVFAHGSAAARQVAKEAPSGAAHSLAPRPSDMIHSPDEMRLLTTEEAIDIRKAGLLSSPKQVIKAVAGHVAAMTTDEMARLPAVGIDVITSAVTGRDRTIGGVRLFDLARAAREGATTGLKTGFRVLFHGPHSLAAQGMSSPILAANHPPFHSGNRLLDTYVNGVFQMHEGAYAALRVYALHRALHEMADVGAINAVRRGVIPRGQRDAFRRQLLSNPSPTMTALAVSQAEEATMTNSNQFSRMYQGAYDKGGPAGKALMAQLVPFPKIESNIAGRSLEMAGGAAYAPLRFAYQVMKQKGFTSDQQRAFGKTFGRGLVGLGLISLGLVIGARKKGQESDEKFHQPGAVQIGGRSYPSNTVAPASNLVQFGIDVVAARDHQQKGEPVDVGNALTNLLTEQPYLKANPGDLTEMLGDSKDAKRMLGNQAGSLVPSVLADVAAQRDPYKRKQAEPLDFVKNRIPGLRETLPVATDALGNPRREAPSRLLNPFGGTPVGAADSPLARQMAWFRDHPAPASVDKKTLKQTLEEAGRGGKDLRPALRQDAHSGKLSLQEALGYARKQAEPNGFNPIVEEFDALPLDRAETAYRLASPAEKALLRFSMETKRLKAADKAFGIASPAEQKNLLPALRAQQSLVQQIQGDWRKSHPAGSYAP